MKVSSIIGLGTTSVAVPLKQIALDNGRLSLGDESKMQLAAKQPFRYNDNSISLAQPTTAWAASWGDMMRWVNPMVPPFDRILIRVDLDPEGASFFVHDENSGTTEVEGYLLPADKDSIRLELKGYRPCQFHNGTYAEPTTSEPSYATFRCKLTAVH